MKKLTKNSEKILKYFEKNNLDWWLFYSYLNINPISEKILWIDFATRRWFMFFWKDWEKFFIANSIEAKIFEKFWEKIFYYKNFSDLKKIFLEKIWSWKKIAMEYSKNCEIPQISKIDAWTKEFIENLWIEIFSSAELVQMTNSLWWWEEWLKSHSNAMKILHESIKMAFEKIWKDVDEKWFADEFEIQNLVMKNFEKNNLITNHPIIVSSGENSSDPHYFPTKNRSRKIKKWDLIMIDVWAKENKKWAIYADITWMWFVWETVPEKIQKVWKIVSWARDDWLNLIKKKLKNNEEIKWFEVDDEVRKKIDNEWFWEFFTHRTGHSIQEEDHWDGVNMDWFEIKDDRKIIPDCWFSIEPWVYIPWEFWIRSEIDVYISEKNEVVVVWDIQKEIILIKNNNKIKKDE